MASPYRASAARSFHISEQTFNQIEEMIEALGKTSRGLNYSTNILARFLAYANLGLAQKMSAGPVDPQQNRPEAAWKLPVRRITGRYYRGWKVRRLLPGVWMLFNDSREAYFIEYGIHPSDARVRRPVRKLSLLKTLRFANQTRVYHRVWSQMYAPLDGSKRGGRGMLAGTQSPLVQAQLTP